MRDTRLTVSIVEWLTVCIASESNDSRLQSFRSLMAGGNSRWFELMNAFQRPMNLWNSTSVDIITIIRSPKHHRWDLSIHILIDSDASRYQRHHVVFIATFFFFLFFFFFYLFFVNINLNEVVEVKFFFIIIFTFLSCHCGHIVCSIVYACIFCVCCRLSTYSI